MKKIVGFAIVALLMLFVLSFSIAGNKYEDIIKDIVKMDNSQDNTFLAWWLPIEFWEEAMKMDGDFSSEDKKEIEKVFKRYVVLAIVHTKINVWGQFVFTSESNIKKSIRIYDEDGIEYKPLENKDLSSEMKELFDQLKPFFASNLGKIGESIYFIVFDTKATKGYSLSARSKGSLTVKCLGKEISWELPLASFIESKVCPKCGKELPGTYNYCPYDGTLLNETSIPK